MAAPANWFEGFSMLKTYLSSIKSKRKKVIFIDELPWLDTHLSGFLPAFEYFWNDWAVDQNIIIVICGSATSWMIENIRNNRGGLHNRISNYLHIQPFTLSETNEFFKAKKIRFDKQEVALIYMAVGGIPHYLQEIKSGLSATQNIDRILFDAKSNLKYEFPNLYRSLFTYYENYEKTIQALAKKKMGLTRSEIAEFTKISNGGGLTKVLIELEECNFIESYLPFGKAKKDTLYQLIDEYSLFYFQFNPQKNDKGTFLNLHSSAQANNWKGKAFEMVCLKHVEKIKMKLGISGIITNAYSFYFKGNKEKEGFQIDLLLDRHDQTITICEIKYSSTPYRMTKIESEKINRRKELFRLLSGSKKNITTILITTHGAEINQYYLSCIDQLVVLSDLF